MVPFSIGTRDQTAPALAAALISLMRKLELLRRARSGPSEALRWSWAHKFHSRLVRLGGTGGWSGSRAPESAAGGSNKITCMFSDNKFLSGAQNGLLCFARPQAVFGYFFANNLLRKLRTNCRETLFLLSTHFVWGAPTKPTDGARGVLHKSQQKLPAVFELETKLAERSERAGSTNFTGGMTAWGVRPACAGRGALSGHLGWRTKKDVHL